MRLNLFLRLMCNTQGSKKQAKYTCCDGLRAPASMTNPPRTDCASDCEPPELCLEDIDFHDSRHVSLLAVLSRSNDFYYIDRTRFLNIKDNCQLASPTGSAHGILAFERGKAVAFIIYHKFDDTNPLHQIYTHPTIEIQFHLVDSKCRRRSIGSALLHVLESQHEMRVICVEVDSSLDSAPYYTKMGYNLPACLLPRRLWQRGELLPSSASDQHRLQPCLLSGLWHLPVLQSQ
jgi:hypothetical protein